VLAHQAGRRIVEMVEEDLKISRILVREAFENAIRVNAAIGGSSNAVLHLLAIAGRLGVKLALDDFDRLGHDLPLLVDLMPSGRFLMEDFYYAGGIPAVVRELGDLIHGDALTVNGKTIRENTAEAPCWNRDVIRERANPIKERAGIAVLHGNLAPGGAVVKPSAATPRLLKHRGRAVVFESIEDLKARTDDPALEIDENSVMVLKGAGPKGYPGMPEVGNMPLPKKLLARGITDVVRISDARMSGTAYGTVVLHVSPEAAVGGPLALVRSGDTIELDVETRRLDLCVPDEELSRRRAAWTPPPPLAKGGYQRLYIDHVLQADQGADLDFLVGCRGADVPRESH
jgi:L-arabonate dehydrase